MLRIYQIWYNILDSGENILRSFILSPDLNNQFGIQEKTFYFSNIEGINKFSITGVSDINASINIAYIKISHLSDISGMVESLNPFGLKTFYLDLAYYNVSIYEEGLLKKSYQPARSRT